MEIKRTAIKTEIRGFDEKNLILWTHEKMRGEISFSKSDGNRNRKRYGTRKTKSDIVWIE